MAEWGIGAKIKIVNLLLLEFCLVILGIAGAIKIHTFIISVLELIMTIFSLFI